MPEYKDVRFGEREMVAQIMGVHLDKKDVECKYTNRAPRSDQVHFILNPISPEGWKNQNWWLYDTLARGSAIHEIVMQFVKLGIIDENDLRKTKTNIELCKLIKEKADNKKFKFVERRIGRAINKNWFPEAIAE